MKSDKESHMQLTRRKEELYELVPNKVIKYTLRYWSMDIVDIKIWNNCEDKPKREGGATWKVQDHVIHQRCKMKMVRLVHFKINLCHQIGLILRGSVEPSMDHLSWKKQLEEEERNGSFDQSWKWEEVFSTWIDQKDRWCKRGSRWIINKTKDEYSIQGRSRWVKRQWPMRQEHNLDMINKKLDMAVHMLELAVHVSLKMKVYGSSNDAELWRGVIRLVKEAIKDFRTRRKEEISRWRKERKKGPMVHGECPRSSPFTLLEVHVRKRSPKEEMDQKYFCSQQKEMVIPSKEGLIYQRKEWAQNHLYFEITF